MVETPEAIASYQPPKSFADSCKLVQEKMLATLDPRQWKHCSQEEAKLNIRRHHCFIGLLTALNSLEVHTDDGPQTVQGTALTFDENNQPKIGELAVYLAMGGRILVECSEDLPADTHVLPAFFGVVDQASFKKEVVGTHTDQLTEKEKQQGKYLSLRHTSTHSLSVKGDQIREQRSFMDGVAKSLTPRFLQDYQEYGNNLAIGGLGNRGADGKEIAADGSKGHLLTYCKKFKNNISGLLFGVESAGYGAKGEYGHDHSITGKASSVSAFGINKFSFFKRMQEKLGNQLDFASQETLDDPISASSSLDSIDSSKSSSSLYLPSLEFKGKEPIGELRVKMTPTLLTQVQQNIAQYNSYAEKTLEVMQWPSKAQESEAKITTSAPKRLRLSQHAPENTLRQQDSVSHSLNALKDTTDSTQHHHDAAKKSQVLKVPTSPKPEL